MCFIIIANCEVFEYMLLIYRLISIFRCNDKWATVYIYIIYPWEWSIDIKHKTWSFKRSYEKLRMHFSHIYFLKGNVYKYIELWDCYFEKFFCFIMYEMKHYCYTWLKKRNEMFPKDNSICSKFQNYL